MDQQPLIYDRTKATADINIQYHTFIPIFGQQHFHCEFFWFFFRRINCVAYIWYRSIKGNAILKTNRIGFHCINSKFAIAQNFFNFPDVVTIQPFTKNWNFLLFTVQHNISWTRHGFANVKPSYSKSVCLSAVLIFYSTCPHLPFGLNRVQIVWTMCLCVPYFWDNKCNK